MTDLTAPSCPDCAHDLAHCHGSLTTHLDGETDCTSPDCATEPAGHHHVSACTPADACCAAHS